MKCAIPVPPKVRRYYITAATAVDGDTIRCTLDLGLGIIIQDAILRLNGVDAPELHIAGQKAAGEVTKAFTAAWLAGINTPSSVYVIKKDKYGRLLGDVIPGEHGVSLVQWLLAKRVVRRYDGGERLLWPAEDLDRISILEVPKSEDICYDP